jgi:hypothetical protein
MKLTLYVPASMESWMGRLILLASAIVGSPAGPLPALAECAGGRIRIDYEGNKYGSAGLKTYAERVYKAANRHITQYPTIARMWVPPAALVEVGVVDVFIHLDPAAFHRAPGPPRFEISDPARLKLWLGVAELEPELQVGRGY